MRLSGVEDMKTTITIRGTHCKACKALIEDVCSDVSGIHSCAVDFATGKTEIEHDETLDWRKVKNEIESVGNYKVEMDTQ